MKEIIYLDTQLVNSLLAQINEGLVTNLVNEFSESDSNSELGTETKSSSAKIGLNSFISGVAGHSESNSDSYAVVFSKTNRNLIETALDDYSLNVLMDSLEDKLKFDNMNIGDTVLIEGDIESYVLDTLINGLELKSIGTDMEGFNDFQKKRAKYDKLTNIERQNKNNAKLVSDVQNSSWNNFHVAKMMAEYMQAIFPDSTLIKIANTLSICDNDMIRINKALLSFTNNSNRKAKILGIVTNQFKERIPTDFSSAKESDGMLRVAPLLFSNIILGSNNIVKQNDMVLRPIAIYFEN